MKENDFDKLMKIMLVILLLLCTVIVIFTTIILIKEVKQGEKICSKHNYEFILESKKDNIYEVQEGYILCHKKIYSEGMLVDIKHKAVKIDEMVN